MCIFCLPGPSKKKRAPPPPSLSPPTEARDVKTKSATLPADTRRQPDTGHVAASTPPVELAPSPPTSPGNASPPSSLTPSLTAALDDALNTLDAELGDTSSDDDDYQDWASPNFVPKPPQNEFQYGGSSESTMAAALKSKMATYDESDSSDAENDFDESDIVFSPKHIAKVDAKTLSREPSFSANPHNTLSREPSFSTNPPPILTPVHLKAITGFRQNSLKIPFKPNVPPKPPKLPVPPKQSQQDIMASLHQELMEQIKNPRLRKLKPAEDRSVVIVPGSPTTTPTITLNILEPPPKDIIVDRCESQASWNNFLEGLNKILDNREGEYV